MSHWPTSRNALCLFVVVASACSGQGHQNLWNKFVMWIESDSMYFKRRAKQDREAARKAVHPIARKAHVAMAERFNEISEAIAVREVAVWDCSRTE